MTDLLIEFVDGGADLDVAFRQWLAGAGLAVTGTGAGSVVPVRGWADCGRFGAALSGFIAGRADSFKLRIDGPGAEFLIHEVRMVADTDSLAKFLATSAGLQ